MCLDVHTCKELRMRTLNDNLAVQCGERIIAQLEPLVAHSSVPNNQVFF